MSGTRFGSLKLKIWSLEIRKNCHQVRWIREIASLQVHTGYLIFSLKNCRYMTKIETFNTWPMPSLSRRSERRRHENIFAESSYTTQLRVQTMHNTRIVLPVASTFARAEICLGCWRDRPVLNTLGLRRGYSDGKAVGNTTGLRRRLHPHWRISLLQSLCRALGQTEASFNF